MGGLLRVLGPPSVGAKSHLTPEARHHSFPAAVREGGEIGRRARFRSVCLTTWGFESLPSHQPARFGVPAWILTQVGPRGSERLDALHLERRPAHMDAETAGFEFAVDTHACAGIDRERTAEAIHGALVRLQLEKPAL